MSRKKEFEEIVGKSGLTSKAIENLRKWYDSDERKILAQNRAKQASSYSLDT